MPGSDGGSAARRVTGRWSWRRRGRPVVLAIASVVVLAGCEALIPVTQAPVVQPASQHDLDRDPVARALQGMDPAAILRGVQGGGACRHGTVTGSHGGGDAWHGAADFVCPRAGDDRTLYFLVAEAYEAELARAGATVGGSGGVSGEATDPILTDWSLSGAAFLGTARLIGVNEPGALHLFVTLDLAAR